MWWDNEVTQGILKKKYLHEGESTFEDLVNRVSSIYSKDIKEDVKTAMMNGDLCPAGRTLLGAGYKGKRRVSLSNCYILGNIKEDTLESISEADYEIARVGSTGGGIGFAVDNIRPKGSRINNAAVVSDGVAFAIRKINQTGQLVGQQFRGMALMCAIDCDHPDVVEFINMKKNHEALESMNLSVKFNDRFMDDVVNNRDHELYFKVEATGEEIRKKINAREFFENMCKVAWDTGDPGVIFIDRVRNYNLVSGYPEYRIDVCNPCVSGDTLILTMDGNKRIDSLVGKSVTIWNGFEWSIVTPQITGYNQNMLRVTLSNGMYLDCTRYHKWVLEDGSRVEAQYLAVGARLHHWWNIVDCHQKIYLEDITVKDIKEISDADVVYCFNEPINHTGVFNGIMTAQCGEYMANEGNSCLLQSINLYNIVDNKFTDGAKINYDKFEHLIRLSIRMMNQTQDYGYDMQPLDKHRKNIDDWRSIGLGIFGLADMFVAMKIKYGSKESIRVVSELFDFMNQVALDESCEEAKKYGTYGKYDWGKQKQSPIIRALRLTENGCKIYDKIEEYGLRNSSILSMAPAGTISLFMGKLSGGCEPLFKLWYERTSHQGEKKNFTFRVMSRSVEDLINYLGLPKDISKEELMKKCPWLIESHDIDPKDRVQLQAIMQEYVDNSISSTINLPNSSTWEDIYNIYISAWKQGCKGVTVFRDGCSRQGILGVDSNKNDESTFKYDSIEPIKRRGVKEVSGKTYRMQTACSRLYITVNYTDDGDLFEIFTNITGGCAANINSLCRLTSAALRSGMKVSTIIEELRAVSCPACQALRRKGEQGIELSCGNAIAKALEMSYNKEDSDVVNTDSGLYECPECGCKTLKLEAKCAVCSNCGYSKCE